MDHMSVQRIAELSGRELRRMFSTEDLEGSLKWMEADLHKANPSYRMVKQMAIDNVKSALGKRASTVSASRVAAKFASKAAPLDQHLGEYLLGVYSSMKKDTWRMDWAPPTNPIVSDGGLGLATTLHTFDVTGDPSGPTRIDKDVGVRIYLELVSLDRLDVNMEVFAGRPMKKGALRLNPSEDPTVTSDKIVQAAGKLFEQAF